MTRLIRVFMVMLLAASYQPPRREANLSGTYESGLVGDEKATYFLHIVEVGRNEYECHWHYQRADSYCNIEHLRLVNGKWISSSEAWRNQLWVLRDGEVAYVISGSSNWWVRRK